MTDIALPPFFSLPGGRGNRTALLILLPPNPSSSTSGSSPNQDEDSEESSFQNLLNSLFQSFQPRGTPPASKNAVSNLAVLSKEELRVTNEELKCTVCFDEFHIEEDQPLEEEQLEGHSEDEDQKVLQLPCKHLYHKGCIVTWFNSHNTCPTCRYELPTDDPEYEQERRKRMASRTNINEQELQINSDQMNPNSDQPSDEQFDPLEEAVQVRNNMNNSNDIPNNNNNSQRNQYSNSEMAALINALLQELEPEIPPRPVNRPATNRSLGRRMINWFGRRFNCLGRRERD